MRSRRSRESDGPPESRLLPRIALAVGATILTLLGAEVAARFHYRGVDARLADVENRRDGGDLTLGDLVEPAPWPDVVYTLRPNLSGTFLDSPYRSNEHGMRWRSVPLHKPPRSFRIALVGDSHAFGWGVPIASSFAAILESSLAKRVPGRRVEILNFGVPGYNTAIEAALVEHRVLEFDPDVIVLQFFMNDYYLPNFLLRAPTPPLSYLARFVRERLAGDGSGRPELVVAARLGDGHGMMQAWMKDPEQVPPELSYMVGAEGVERALQRLRDVTEARGVPVFFFDFRVPPDGALVRPDDEIAALVDRHALDFATGLGFVGFTTVLGMKHRMVAAGKTRSDLVLSAEDWHLNETGHRFMADVLAEGLLESGLLER